MKMGKSMRYFRGIFLNALLTLLSFIVSKKEKQILIGSGYGDKFFGSPKYFFLYLCEKKNKDYQVLWITARKKIYSELREKKLPVVFLYSLKGFISILRSNYLVFDHNPRGVSYGPILPGHFNKIETCHGTGFKKDWRLKKNNLKRKLIKLQIKLVTNERKTYHTVVFCSDTWKEKNVNVFAKNKMKVLGYPRNDVFFDQSIIYENYYKKLRLDAYEKVILYCPTYRQYLSSKIPFSENFLELLNAYLKNKNYILLEKRHIGDKRIEINHNLSNIVDVTDKIEDIQDLLVNTDILITDYSTIHADFCLTGRPIIFYPYDFEEYDEITNLNLDYFNDLPGPFARNEDELMSCIKNIENITLEKSYQEKYQKLKNINHFFQDGKSSERLYNYLTKSS